MKLQILSYVLSFAVISLATPVLATESQSAWLKDHALQVSASRAVEQSDLNWYDAKQLTIEGRGFTDTETPYTRLSKADKKIVTRAVWTHGKSSAGVTVRFVTDSTTISAAWDNHEPMNHMAYTGSGGLDLYAREGDSWVYRGTGIPTSTNSLALIQKNRKDTSEATEYLLFLPLYSTVHKLEIGVTDGATIAPAPDAYKDQKPIVFYGTSITQGGCASRAGMSHTGLLRRWLDRPVINLGFSGSGKCEMGMSNVLAKIPASLYIIETVPNMTAPMITERVVPFIKHLRNKHADTPILMVESPNTKDVAPNAAWRKAYDDLVAAGITNLSYMTSAGQYAGDENPTVDGVHPTDLGFYQMAKAYEPELRRILKIEK